MLGIYECVAGGWSEEDWMTMFPYPVGQPTWQQLAEDDDEETDYDNVHMSGEDLDIWTVHLNRLILRMYTSHQDMDLFHVDLQGHLVKPNLESRLPWVNAAGLASVHAAARARLLAMSEADRAVYTLQYYHGDTWQEQVDLVTQLECKWRNIGLAMQDYFEENGPWW